MNQGWIDEQFYNMESKGAWGSYLVSRVKGCERSSGKLFYAPEQMKRQEHPIQYEPERFFSFSETISIFSWEVSANN